MRTSIRATSDGFTLIELTLVLLILGVMLTFAVPRLSTLGEARLDSSARSLAAMLTYLHDESALRGRIYRLTLDIDADTYSVEVQAPFAEGEVGEGLTVEWDPYAASATLPEGIDLARVETASDVRTNGSASVFFLPEDTLEGVTITLVEGDGRGLDLELEPVTGRVEIRASDATR